MARFSAAYMWSEPSGSTRRPSVQDPRLALSGVLESLGFAVIGSCPTGVAALRVDRLHDLRIRLVLSWSRQASDAAGLQIAAEMLSNEAMASGAPITRSCFRGVHTALLEALPALRPGPAGLGPNRRGPARVDGGDPGLQQAA
jgi:hypothetical protein